MEDWLYLGSNDSFFCITTTNSYRIELIKHIFDEQGLKVRIIENIRDGEDPRRGCFNSHKRIMQIAKDENLNRVIVFEDDVFFDWRKQPKKQVLQEINHFFNNKNYNWDVFFLGCVPLKKYRKTEYPNISKLKYGTFAHAYIANKTFIDKVLNTEYIGQHYDVLFKKCNLYTINKMIAFQNDFPTNLDNSKTYMILSKLRNFIGAKRLCCSMEKMLSF